MARTRAGVTLKVDYVVADAARRSYGFAFAVREGVNVSLVYDGQSISPNRYTVLVNASRTGGQVRLLDAADTTDPLATEVGKTLTIERNTEVARLSSYGETGYATAVTAEREAVRVFAILEELAARLTVHADIHLSEPEIRRLLSQIEITSIADGAVDYDALAAGVKRRIDDKIESGSLEFDPDLRLLTWVDGSGTAMSENIPGGAAAPSKAEIYRVLKTIFVEGTDIDLDEDDATSEFTFNVTGGSQRAGFLRSAPAMAADVTITTPAPSAQGAWSGWSTLTTLSAITAEEAGEVILVAEVHGEAVEESTTGGERLLVESRLIRRRGAVDTTVSDHVDYSPRNIQPGGATSTEFAEASEDSDEELVAVVSAQEGDVYRVEARIITQVTSGGTRSMVFNIARNTLTLAALGGPRGAKGAKGDKGDHGIRPYTRTLAAGLQVDITARNTAFEVPTIAIPPDEEDRFLGLLLAAVAIEPGATSIPIATLRARPTVEAGDALSGINGIEFTNAATGGTRRYFAGWNAAGNLVLASDHVDTYQLTATVTEPDIEDFARRSGTAKVERDDLADDQQIPALTQGQLIRGDATGNPEAVDDPLPAVAAGKWLRGNAGGNAWEAFDSPLPAPVEGSFLRWVGGVLANIAAPILSISEVDARIAPFAKINALVNATISKVQEIINAFTGGGWADAAGGADEAPYVRLEIKASQYNAVDIKGGTYGLQQHQGPHVAAGWIGVRVPADYSIPLQRVRLYMGDEVYGPDDPEQHATGYRSYLLDEAPVMHITTDADYAYYSVGPIIHPAGAFWRAQVFSLFQLNRSKIGGDELLPPVGSEGQILKVVSGVPAYADETTPRTLGTVLVASRDFTLNLALGTDRDVRSTAPTYWNPAFDLDDMDKMHGEFHFSCDMRIDLPAVSPDVNMSFVRGKANATDEDRRRVFSNIIFSSTLQNAGDFVFSATEDLAGVNALEMTVYSLNTVAGTAVVMGVHNADNEGGDYVHYEGEAGATTPVLRGTLNVTFTPTDPGRAVGYRVRGRKVGETSALPVGAIARGTRIGANTAIGSNWPFFWTIPAGVMGYGGQPSIVSTHAFNPPILSLPGNPPADEVDGFVVRTKVGDDYVQTLILNWGPGSLTDEGTGDRADFSETTLFFRGGAFSAGAAARLNLRYILTDEGHAQFELYGDGTALPANSIVEVYEKGVYAAA